ncbi:MAG: ethanolamine ammonia-lyase subunit EutC [Pseudomonadota bacterium]
MTRRVVPRGAADPADDGWAGLRQWTAARIGLARSGASLATAPLLDFRLAHAQARDAVHESLDVARLLVDLAAIGLPGCAVASAAADRRSYLMRPDLGRRLAPEAAATLAPLAGDPELGLAIVIADGLSARAVQAHAVPVLAEALPTLQADGWRLAAPVVVRQGRVAVGDAVAAALGARAVALLIGERPGLSAPDSLGMYLTWQPGPATTDAERNCISNVRLAGVPYRDAAFKLAYLLRAMRRRRLSGVALKDDSDRLLIGEEPA